MRAPDGDRTLVRRVRVRGAAADPLAGRLRAAALVGGADLRPAGLPAAAVVCIRRFPDPRPRTMALGRPPTAPTFEWRRAAAMVLDRLVGNAGRPADGPIHAGAEAVLFADWAEVLTCLATDWLDGSLGSRWWWPVLLGSGVDCRPPASWLAEPRYVPTALTALADRGRAREFVQELSDAEARTLHRAVVETHEAPALLAALQWVPPDSMSSRVRDVEPRTATDERPPAPRREPIEGPRPAFAPWETFTRGCGVGLGVERQTFLGVVLALGRAAHIARSARFAEAVRTWRESAIVVHRSEWTPPAADGGTLPTLMSGESGGTPTGGPPPVGPTGQAEAPIYRAADEIVLDARADMGSDPRPQALTPPTDKPHRGPHRVPPDRAEAAISGRVDTELAGLFYLVNLALFLDLYGDFTAPARPGIGLSVWDFISLVGRELLGDAATDDPVWDLLARLAGREPTTPAGDEFTPPAEWRVPPHWLRPFDEPGDWTWAVAGERLRVRHPVGFDVLDVTWTGADQLRDELAAYGVSSAEPGETTDPSAGNWLGWLMPYIRARLDRALRPTADQDLGQLLCAAPGRVLVSPAHIEVRIALAVLPIEVRLAGLDRDPGWVPAAGRVIGFRFD